MPEVMTFRCAFVMRGGRKPCVVEVICTFAEGRSDVPPTIKFFAPLNHAIAFDLLIFVPSTPLPKKRLCPFHTYTDISAEFSEDAPMPVRLAAEVPMLI